MSVNNSSGDAVAPCTRQEPMKSEAVSGCGKAKVFAPGFHGGSDLWSGADQAGELTEFHIEGENWRSA
jgi:hypothetical protein